MKFDLEKDKIELVKEWDPSAPRIRGDMYQLQQVFLNIINNARYSMRNRKVPRLSIATQVQEASLHISFTDNGAGIPEHIVHRIFEPFFTTKEEASNAGLGLSISYGIIKEHNGTIAVESQEGVGSTFTIVLPIPQNR